LESILSLIKYQEKYCCMKVSFVNWKEGEMTMSKDMNEHNIKIKIEEDEYIYIEYFEA
tara:strand:+ start:735 stop:908 length:174 start_codon:yes stop_codon:yes gene_type:complete